MHQGINSCFRGSITSAEKWSGALVFPGNPFADKYSMICLCKHTYENPMLMNNIIIHGHRPIPVEVCKNIVHSNNTVINPDTGCVYLNMTGYGTLPAIELNTRSLYLHEFI